ncbi:hypothetical protein PAMP_023325 [Pampus punctatissimus]
MSGWTAEEREEEEDDEEEGDIICWKRGPVRAITSPDSLTFETEPSRVKLRPFSSFPCDRWTTHSASVPVRTGKWTRHDKVRREGSWGECAQEHMSCDSADALGGFKSP